MAQIQIYGTIPSGGGNLQNKEVTITENTETIIEPDSEYDGLESVKVNTSVLDTPFVVDQSYTSTSTPRYYIGIASQFIDKVTVNPVTDNWRYLFYGFENLITANIKSNTKPTNIENMFQNCTKLKTVSLFDTSNVSNFKRVFFQCTSLIEIPPFDTSNVTTFDSAFANCSALVTIPVLNASSVVNSDGFANMFQGSSALSDDSLNNILAMCISAINYQGSKSLRSVGIYVNDTPQYTLDRMLALPNYQAFLDAGWTLT